MGATVRGLRCAYYEAGVALTDAQHIADGAFINDDESGLHQDDEVWLEGLAPHAPIERGWHKRAGEARPGNQNARTEVTPEDWTLEILIADVSARHDSLSRYIERVCPRGWGL